MLRRNLPAIDDALVPQAGVTRLGQPLSYSRPPADDLSPWVARLYASVVDAPEDHRIECSLLNDSTVIRIQLRGLWTAETRDGPRQNGRAALHFGPQSRVMKVGVTGSFTSIGIALRPGAGAAITGLSAADFVDRITACDDLGFPGTDSLGRFDEIASPEDQLRLLEEMLRGVIDQAWAAVPDPITANFELATYADPTFSIADFARDHDIGQRQLERIISRDFGMSPKQVLGRARALDMASHLRGVADEEEAEELILRYYDQSHLIRDFTKLFGMSPGQFVAKPQPILTLALETRQARRLEAINRLAPGDRRPWE